MLVAQFRDDDIATLAKGLEGLPRMLQRKTLKPPLKHAFRLVQRRAKSSAPRLSPRHPMATSGQRIPGLMRRKIGLWYSKIQQSRGNVGVFVKVRTTRDFRNNMSFSPFPKKLRRTKRHGWQPVVYRPKDPFYYKFVEAGTRKIRARKFLGGALASQGQAALKTFLTEAVPAIRQLRAVNTKRA